MIGELRTHANLIDGPAWLGPIPSTWQLVRAKAVLRERTQKNHPNEPLLAATQTIGVVRKDRFEGRTVLPMGALELLKFVKVGDFVISLRSFQGGIEQARDQGIISPAYTVLRSVEAGHSAYLGRLFKSKPFVENLGTYVTGIRQGQNIDYERLSRSRIPLPPPAEQAAIVKFLDHADRKIRRYIRAKQKLIALLEEQKQAIIHRAVTRGLNPDVPLKRSGVPWLGDIPAHWEVSQIRRFAAVGNGSTPSRSNTAYWLTGTIPWLNSGCVNAEIVTAPDQFVTEVALRECHLPIVKANSVLIAITGQGKTRGKSALLTFDSTINQHLAYITPTSTGATTVPAFLREALTAGYAELRRISDDAGSTKGALTCEAVRLFPIPVPPVDEQTTILSTLAERLRGIQGSSGRAQREIALLNELRTRLIADVVTGKVDVREAAATLPDEQEGPDIPEDADLSMADEEAAETDLSAED